MGRPLGSKNKPKDGEQEEETVFNEVPNIVVEENKFKIQNEEIEVNEVEKEMAKGVSKEVAKEVVKQKTAHEIAIEESRKVLEHPLSPGQRFFEAPDGYIIVGEADAQKILYRAGNDGKGMYINPMR
jgi:hypothetical protein